MKIKNAITVTALSALILAGCGTDKAAVDGSSESETLLDVNGVEFETIVEENEEVVEDEEVIEEVNDEEGKLESPYDEIATYFSEWDLPEEGILPKDHEVYYGLAVEIVAYENGYMFEKETKDYFGRFSEANAPTPEPTKEQATGLLMGIVTEVAGDLTNSAEQNPHLQEGNLDVYNIVNFLPWITLKFEEVVKYSNHEELTNVSTEILNLAKELTKELEDVDPDEVLEDANIKYSEMVDKIYQLNKATGQEELI